VIAKHVGKFDVWEVFAALLGTLILFVPFTSAMVELAVWALVEFYGIKVVALIHVI